MRIISLNANGIRAAVNKGLATWWEASDSDILCIQESRLQDKDWPIATKGMTQGDAQALSNSVHDVILSQLKTYRKLS